MKNFEMPIDVVFTCPFCGKAHTVTVEVKDYFNYQEGALVQDAFPYLSADEREAFISGMCPDCCKKIFIEF